MPAVAPIQPLPGMPAVAPLPAAQPRPGVPATARPPAQAPAGGTPRQPAASPGNLGGLDAAQLSDLVQRCRALNQLDYFELLKLEKTAGPADIKKAFYRDSRTFHPDRFYHLENAELKERVNDLYKRVTEAYYVLRDDGKRKQYLADVTGPERARKLRFSDLSEAETKQAAKKEAEEQIGTHPKGRQFFQSGMADFAAERWSGAERNFKMALTFEPANARYKEKLTQVQQKLQEEAKNKGGFKIK